MRRRLVVGAAVTVAALLGAAAWFVASTRGSLEDGEPEVRPTRTSRSDVVDLYIPIRSRGPAPEGALGPEWSQRSPDGLHTSHGYSTETLRDSGARGDEAWGGRGQAGHVEVHTTWQLSPYEEEDLTADQVDELRASAAERVYLLTVLYKADDGNGAVRRYEVPGDRLQAVLYELGDQLGESNEVLSVEAKAPAGAEPGTEP